MSEGQALLAAVLADPGDSRWHPDAVGAYRDWLDERGRWSCEAAMTLVLAYPEVDGPRLLAARWWEENGESERAEFVRVQCDIVSWKPPYSPWCGRCGWVYEQCRCGPNRKWPPEQIRLEALRRREGELLGRCHLWPRIGGYGVARATYADTVTKLFPPGGGPEIANVGFRRGFISHVTCTAADWLKHGDAILAAQPVEEVTLTTWPQQGWILNRASYCSEESVRGILHLLYSRVRHWHLPPVAAIDNELAEAAGRRIAQEVEQQVIDGW